MGLGPIPSSAIRAYARDVLGLDPRSDAADDFFSMIRRMDGEYIGASNTTSADPKKAATVVDVDDAIGVTRLFDVIETRKRHQKAAEAEGKERT